MSQPTNSKAYLAKLALQSLYLAVDLSVARDVDDKMSDYVMELQEEIKELREALEGILDIGKRDMSNPKYDTYFTTAKDVVKKSRDKHL